MCSPCRSSARQNTARARRSLEESAKRNADIGAQLASPPLGNFWPELGHAPTLTSLIVEILLEYACHEGNYALVNMLRISRAAER